MQSRRDRRDADPRAAEPAAAATRRYADTPIRGSADTPIHVLDLLKLLRHLHKNTPMDFTGYDKSFGLTNKVSLITGGAAGIGRAIATLFAEKGAKLVLADLNPDIPKIAQEICADANRVETVTADLTNTADRERVVQAAVNRFGRIDILVNNAGIVLLDDALNLSEEYWDKTMAGNLRAPV